MKASELMIGDLVKTNKGDIIKVESISTKRQHRKAGYHTKDDITHIKYVRQGQIVPIPLTEEMLFANGFEKGYSDGDYYRIYKPNTFLISFDPTLGFVICVTCRVIRIKYVHELQHALRLSGLTDLADNFKLKKDEQV